MLFDGNHRAQPEPEGGRLCSLLEAQRRGFHRSKWCTLCHCEAVWTVFDSGQQVAARWTRRLATHNDEASHRKPRKCRSRDEGDGRLCWRAQASLRPLLEAWRAAVGLAEADQRRRLPMAAVRV